MTDLSKPQRLLTQAEVAERFGMSIRNIARLRANGELGYLPGRPVRIPETEIDAYIERNLVRHARKAEEDKAAAARAADERINRRVERIWRSMTPQDVAFFHKHHPRRS